MTTSATHRRPVEPSAPTGVRRLLHAADSAAPSSLRAHRAQFARPELRRRADSDLIAVVERSGLRGRGGAGFPTARKLRAVADGGRKPVVVVNGTEGEPASHKDATLLRIAPHLVLDGAEQAAAAVGASEIFVCIERTNTTGLHVIRRALEERAQGGSGGASVKVLASPPRYVAGEETALVHWINGGDARPTTTPPRPYQRGVAGRPTLVSNVETLAHLAQIVQFGPDWFRGIGTESEPGTVLTTVGGAVSKPAIYEVATGSGLADLVRAAGISNGVRAVLMGGYFGSWLSPEAAAAARLGNDSLRSIGAAFGCGVVAVLPNHACGVSESSRVLRWMAAETAGQCGPCVNGLGAVASTFGALASGSGHASDLATLQRWATQIEGRGACRFPDGAMRFLRSALALFGDDLERHARGYPCRESRNPAVLPIPRSVEVWR